jgi:hypothetical protein
MRGFMSEHPAPSVRDTEPFGKMLVLAIEVDLSALIERVYVSPTAPPWFGNLVGAMVAARQNH